MKTYPIKSLYKPSYPRFMIFFDTETNQLKRDERTDEHHFRLGAAIYTELDQDYKLVKREIYYFDRVGQFWKFVYSKAANDRVLYIFGHNVKYDLMAVQFQKGLEAIGFKSSFPVLGNNFILNARTGRRKLKILDTFNYFKVKLKTIGKAVNQPKIRLKNTCKIKLLSNYKPKPIRLNKISKRNIYFNRIEDKVLYPYCLNDVEIVEKIILKYIEFLRSDNGLGSLENTAASTAFNIFRTRFNTGEIHYHMDKELLAFERAAYKGGRVECFYIGKKKDHFHLFDVNSLYPYIMANFELPTKPLIQCERLTRNEALKYSQNYYLISECELSYKSEIGLYGTHYENKLLFPIGTFKTHLHNPEIIRAIENGDLISIGKTVVYEKSYCLRDYANYFYKVRINATDDTFKLLSKLMNNSLYGRFGMSHYDKDVIDWPLGLDDNPLGIVPIPEIKNGRKIIRIYYRWFDKIVHPIKNELEPKSNTNIALAGAVTAQGRMILLDYALKVKRDELFYGDTDSLLVNESGAGRLQEYIDSKALGKLKHELYCENIQINAPKDYQFGARRKIKGIPSNYVYEDGEYNFIRFSTMREYLKNGGEFFGTRKEKKILTHIYNKGIILDNGFTRPLELPI